jgi:acetyl esterase/lipase
MIALLVLAAVGWPVAAQRERPPLPTPDHANVAYGQHERNVLDLWLAKGDTPTPLVIYYHGGGFRGGDKGSLNRDLLRMLLESGISVAAANYRLSDVAPYPAQMHDCARALQFLRLHAKKYNINPERVGATGGSAGSGISQWLAYHDDLADPSNEDPLLRQSTRLTAIVPFNAQTSYDPRVIMKLMNTDKVHEALVAFFGMKSAADVDEPKFHPLFEDSSPINHLTADDPPILFFFSQRNDPLPPNSTGRQHIHHPKFGFLLKEKADELGVECNVLLREQFPEEQPVERYVEFFKEKLLK